MKTSQASGQPVSISINLLGVMRQHPLFFYFLIAYAFSWIVFLPYILAEWGRLSGDFTIFYIIHTFGPVVSAIVMTAIIAGKAGLNELRQRIRQWRAPWQWYLFIVLGIPALVMLGVMLQPRALAGYQGLTTSLLVSYPLFYVLTFFGGGPLGEEPGWRGFALPRMQVRYGPLGGTLLLGLLWSCWHLPDFLTGSKGGGPSADWMTFFENFPVFSLAVISLAVIMTWIYNHTGGSLFIAILAHAGVNTPEVSGLLALFPTVSMISLHMALLAGFGVPALLILILTRGRLGYKPG